MVVVRAVRLGFDAGSVALKVVVMDGSGHVLERSYTRTQGRPVETALEVFGALTQRYGRSFDLVAGTGSAGRLICELLDVPFVNEVICQASAIKHLVPEARTVIEMGGQDSKLIFLPEGAANGRPIVDFAMNTNCAAGTGSFLDQQASRLGVSIDGEFGDLALECRNPPRVAGRCSVFAKSDMIHLQQQAASVSDIVAGLCLGLARNLKSNLGRGMELARPIVFCGGVAANKGVVHAIGEAFELASGELIVPEEHACTGALGAALVCLKERQQRGEDYGRLALRLENLQQYLEQTRSIGYRVDPLRPAAGGEPDAAMPTRRQLEQRAATGLIDAWFGLDVGSISTKGAVIDADNRVLAKIYLMTAGRPLEAVRNVLKEIGRQVGGLVNIRGATTTGSGRYLTGDFIGADLVINEITAQATAAAALDPEVDTIFEIGGQDSKYISLDRGVVVDFEMNHACAAGTGSFLEEQAERLGVSVKDQFASLALASQAPIRLGERCTVFMESDLLCYQQQGARTDDLVAGLCYSIVSNYINRVVGRRGIGKRIFFQGGTAFNQGVVAAFEQVTGRRITVPPHHEVTGAIGAAVLGRRHQQRLGRETSDFLGFDLADVHYGLRSFECDACSNNCEINEVSIPGREALYYGSRCDRYNVKKSASAGQAIPNLFAERLRLLFKCANLASEPVPGRPTIGIPLALSSYQLLPLWGTLLGELGYNVAITRASTEQIIHRGVEAVLSAPCFPVKVAHGHVIELIERGVDLIWLPSMISMGREFAENEYNQVCPYVTAIPYQVAAALESSGRKATILQPPVRMQDGLRDVYRSLRPFCGQLKVTPRQLRKALAVAWAAQAEFETACRERGRQILDNLPAGQRAVVIVSRPYNGCDSGVSLDLPNKLRKLGVLPIPMDFLDLRSQDTPSGDRVMRWMYWKYGQRILRAGTLVREDPRLHAIYLSNFSCGPDSFLINYFKRMMAPKPSLLLETDEHSAGAGVVTRLEAFLESLNNVSAEKPPTRLPLYPEHSGNGHLRTLYIPWMGDIAHGLAAAMRAHGQPAEVIPVADQESIELGRRHCTGKECLPCIITTGDMVRMAQQPGFDPDTSAFFMPGGAGPCRFGQYNALHKLVLSDIGYPDVPVFAPSQNKDFYDYWKRMGSGGDPSRLAWIGICAIEVLHKALLAVRPYELEAGQADRLYSQCLQEICRLIERKPTDRQVVQMMRQVAARFCAIPADRSRPRPKIGVLGEIYVRHHTASNNDLVRQLESLGAEVDMAGFTEFLFYTNWVRKGESWRDGNLRLWLANLLRNRVQHRLQHRINEPFEPLLGDVNEPPTTEVLDLADPYIDRSFEGEAVLSIGKLLEFHRHGCHGVINVMPFACMPSTIVGGVAKRLTPVIGQMPVLSISYDGQQDPTMHTRLEAFIYQARACQNAGHVPAHA
jgi:predicted CoA-substrate-specific enzyme activase